MAKEKEEMTQVDVLQQIAATLAQVQAQATGGSNIGAALEKITETLAGVANRARPENPEHTHISAFNPRGLRPEARPQLKCDVYWVGHPETPDTLLDSEIEALNALEPGEYRVTKANGNTIPFTVEAKRNEGGKLTELWVRFPCKGDQSTDHRSKTDYCREAMGEKVPSLTDLMQQVRDLKAQNDALHAVVEGA